MSPEKADLNACANLEQMLKDRGIFSSYVSALAMVCGFKAHGDEAWHKLHAGIEAVVSATAQQRSQAFLQTMGLWDAEKEPRQ